MTTTPVPSPTYVPVTAFSNKAGVTGWPSLRIGDQAELNSSAVGSHFWWVVVDLTVSSNLQVVVNTTSTDTTSVPSEVAKYVGSESHFLFFICCEQMTFNLPTGKLASTLHDIGAKSELRRLEQVIEQIGTGSVSEWAYILAATMDTKDAGGFEVNDNFNPALLTMQFMQVDNQYVPLTWSPW